MGCWDIDYVYSRCRPCNVATVNWLAVLYSCYCSTRVCQRLWRSKLDDTHMYLGRSQVNIFFQSSKVTYYTSIIIYIKCSLRMHKREQLYWCATERTCKLVFLMSISETIGI